MKTITIIDFRKIKFLILIFLIGSMPLQCFSQVVLEADGPGDTYELINSVLAPGYEAVESPDCAHPEFGRHITEVWDDALQQYVFEFHIHVTPDNDRCINDDRQRMEIKTYASSPENLKGVAGETVIYKWKFKLDAAFQPSTSFTHIHQLKAVGGSEEDMPLITFTPRKSSANTMQIRYAENTSQTTIHSVDLSLFLGEWVEVYEKVLYGESGSFELRITRLSDQETILDFSRGAIRMWKTDADFIRPKWGIYRSLNVPSDLRDEAVRFAGFSIEEEQSTAIRPSNGQGKARLNLYPNPTSESVIFEYDLPETVDAKLELYNLNGQVIKSVVHHERQINGQYKKELDVSGIPEGIYFVSLSSANFNQTSKLSISR